MDEAIKRALQILGYEKIRPNQELVIKGYLNGKDVLFCSPTGSGKSLTFEIAPFAFKYMVHNSSQLSSVMVVSPLVALMQYQAEQLQKKGVKAVYLQNIASAASENVQNITMDYVASGRSDIIFASPESLLGEFRYLLTSLASKKALRAIFIDEAHCIKKFGKGDKKRKESPFRPQYGELGQLRSLVQKCVPVIALTATATEETRNIIIKDLCMQNCEQIIVDPNKLNVKYSVEQTNEKEVSNNFHWLLQLLQSYGIECPRIIIFFRQIKHIAEVFEYLQFNLRENQYVNCSADKENGYWNRLFAMFHMSTSDKIKKAVCKSFQDETGNVRIVLCSTSFSMGLDIKNVHTVVHYGPANDIDDYLQESGRAGRDPSKQCNAILIKYKYSLNSQNIAAEMKAYVKESNCRRLCLMLPFTKDAKSLKPRHDCCDMCTLRCNCVCKCFGNCICTTNTCSVVESSILMSIRSSLVNQENESLSESSDEEFDSDSDIEEFIRRRPVLIESSDSD